TEAEIKKLKYPYGVFSKGWRWFNYRILKNTNNLFDPKNLDKTGDIYLDGYWQSLDYFSDIRDVLLIDLSLKKPFSNPAQIYADAINDSASVSIHVRRGDYAKNPRVLKEFGVCSADYYQQAVAEIEKQVSNPTYFVFSDD